EVAKGSVQADRLGCRQPCAFQLNRRVPHRKDRAVKRVEPPVPNASRDLLGRKPAVDELAQGKDSPLVAGAPRDDLIGPRLHLVPATGGKYSLDVGSGVVPGLVLVAGVAHALVHCWSLPSLLSPTNTSECQLRAGFVNTPGLSSAPWRLDLDVGPLRPFATSFGRCSTRW